MTNQALPGRLPPHDLSAFDLSKRSPDQVAQSFARWKAQRKRQAEARPAHADPLSASKPAVASGGDAVAEETRRPSAEHAPSPRYSAPFSDLLAAGSEPTIQRTDRAPIAALRSPQRTTSPGRRLKVMSIVAGAASVLALAGGALLELADWRDPPAEVAPQVTHVRPRETPMALAAVATSLPAVGWTLQHTVDAALMKAVPDAPRPAAGPPTPTVQTASKTAPAAVDKPVLPERKSVAPETERFVAKPFVPNVAPSPMPPMPAAQTTAPIPAAPVAATSHAGDPRPDGLFQHGRDQRSGTLAGRTVSNGGASDGARAAATGTGSAVDGRSASVRKATSGGSVDPRGEGSGGARVGIDGEAGAPSAASSGSVSGGSSEAGDAGDGSGDGEAGGGSSAGAADGAGAPGDSTGDAGVGDSGAGGGNAGGDTSGDAGDGGDSDAGEDGESDGIGGAVGGALGAVGEALGGALGGGKGNPDSNDKDRRN